MVADPQKRPSFDSEVDKALYFALRLKEVICWRAGGIFCSLLFTCFLGSGCMQTASALHIVYQQPNELTLSVLSEQFHFNWSMLYVYLILIPVSVYWYWLYACISLCHLVLSILIASGCCRMASQLPRMAPASCLEWTIRGVAKLMEDGTDMVLGYGVSWDWLHMWKLQYLLYEVLKPTPGQELELL